jgi:hypothetical protein
MLIWENIQFTKFGYCSWNECGTVPSQGLHCCAGCRPLPRSPILGARAHTPGGRRRGAPPLVERTACHPSNALLLSSKCSDLLEYMRSIDARRPIPCWYPPLLELNMPSLTSFPGLNIGRPARVDTRRPPCLDSGFGQVAKELAAATCCCINRTLEPSSMFLHTARTTALLTEDYVFQQGLVELITGSPVFGQLAQPRQ